MGKLNEEQTRAVAESEGSLSAGTFDCYEGEVVDNEFRGLIVGKVDTVEAAEAWLAGDDSVNFTLRAASPGRWLAS